jgi:multidrug resistance efflux pump
MTPISPAIPTTPAVYWRTFRHRAAPYIVFGVVLCSAVLIWNRRLGHSTIVGRAETVHTAVTARQSGVLVSLKVDLLQRVKRGDVLAEVVPADAEAIRAGLTSNLESLRAQLQQGTERNTVNLQQLRVDWLRRKLDLAAAQVDLQLAESDYRRISTLHNSRIVSDSDFDAKQGSRDALKVKVETLTKLTNEMEHEMLKPDGPPPENTETPAERALTAATIRLQKQLEAQADATVVRAPMDGVVSAITKQEGENVALGEAIVTLGAIHPTRIVAYIRQPLRLQLHAGDTVNVSSRGTRATKPAHVLRVGAQLEPIDSSLLPTMMSARVLEFGLPLLIEVPAALDLAPGEVVNIATSPLK